MKKFLSLLLVLAMVLSMAMPVTAVAETKLPIEQILTMKDAEKNPASPDMMVYPYSQTFGATVIKGGYTVLQFKLNQSRPSSDLFAVSIVRGSLEDIAVTGELDVVEERIYKMSDFYNNSLGMTWKADSRYSVGEYTMIAVILDKNEQFYDQAYYYVDLYVVNQYIPASGMELYRVESTEYLDLPDSLPYGTTYCFDYALEPYINTADRTLSVSSTNSELLSIRVDAGYIYVTAKGTGNVVITVKCGNISRSFPLYVGNEAVPTFSLISNNTTLCTGMTDKPVVDFRDPGFPVVANVYSENPTVVSVVNGVVTAVAPGTAKVTAQIAQKKQSITYTVVDHNLPENTPVSQRTATKPAMQVGPCSLCGQEDAVNIIEKAVFTDTDYKAWYSDHVDYVYDQQIMNGTGANTFGPDMALSRAMVVTVLYRAAGSPEVTGEIPFADVEEGMWYSDAILWAYQNEVVKGVGDGSRFDPNGNITREQIATILYRYTQSLGVEMAESADLNTYPDGAMVSAYAEEGMAWAVGEGLITGAVSNGVTTLSPWNTATRAQFATIISRYQQMFPADSE